ncbi:MAG: FkbM family methyltransferase [Hyphomicrobium sp.]|nr:FkbM family methyltransferase [Hyphomicrobium sp.]
MTNTPLSDCLGIRPRLKIVDIGASAIDGAPPYAALLESTDAEVIGFEPDPQAWQELQEAKRPNEHYLPFALGDGRTHELKICAAPGMTSLLEPNLPILQLLPGFPEWGRVIRRVPVETRRLGEMPETQDVDYLKLDVQGAELLILRHAGERLREACVIHVEVEFLRLYHEQPLFSDVDMFLRRHGFTLHKFAHTVSRMIAPLHLSSNPYQGLSQLVWADAVFIRDFERLDAMDDRKLLATASILHDCYGSYDVCMHYLARLDARSGSGLAEAYLAALKGPATATAA